MNTAEDHKDKWGTGAHEQMVKEKGLYKCQHRLKCNLSPLKPEIIEKTETDSSWLCTVKRLRSDCRKINSYWKQRKKPKHFHSGVVKHWNCWENLKNLQPWRYLTHLDKAQETWLNFEVGFALGRGPAALQRFLPTDIALLIRWTLIKMNWFK